ncbi:transcriptional regulator [Amycolatopsis keratiniphila subsp. nogabecina]|uniref:ABC transporter ATP-binding protein n=1 Tax=Amycolatopsis keratiniphila TaxID=129921 RepID=UPI000907BA36|nr:ABC transporter ATP-binding protein [Amycolatopsis keratiniphila]OLZ43524.1 transcriptional regulator [Amycolatopsis keratiniphila subsp. nogabecina]
MLVEQRDAVVAVTDLDVRVHRSPVLRGLDLVVRPGEVFGVLGPNGSGKSTLLRVLATLLRPAGGSVTVLGARLGTPEAQRVRPSIALVGHQSALHPLLTLEENLRYLATLTGQPGSAVTAALDLVGLGQAAHRRANQCSQGMLRRADLARVILTAPKLLLLDEPHAGLDPASFGLVDLVVHRVRIRGGAAVVVSHDIPRLTSLADRLALLEGGRLVPCVHEFAPDGEHR